MNERLNTYLRILLVVTLCVFLFALQISARLHKLITDPILHLVSKAKTISQSKDYSLRAEITSDDEIGELTSAFNDMLAEIQSSHKKLVFEAHHDSLTGLPNRALLFERIQRMIERQKRHPDYKFAILFIDLDRFKLINDSLGHAIGDKLLKELGDRLQKSIRSVDTVARIGGDEFVVLLEEVGDDNDTAYVAQRLLEEISHPFRLDKDEIMTTASIGIAVHHAAQKRAEEFLTDADDAMYRAKSLGKARFQIFDTSMQTKAVGRLKLEMELREAIKDQNFVIYYQPIFSIDKLEIVRVEALIRWQHVTRGLLPPVEFVPIAEETRLIQPIGRWILNEAVKQYALWEKEGLGQIDVAVNFSSRQFEEDGIVQYIFDVLDDYQMKAKHLDIEVTESIALKEGKYGMSALIELHKRGIQITIDDFGIGFSSLSYLKDFPASNIKIDKSLIEQIGSDKNSLSIVKTIILLGHSLDHKVIAEGVSSKNHLKVLKECKCDMAQGFLLGRPLPADEMTKMLKSQIT